MGGNCFRVWNWDPIFSSVLCASDPWSLYWPYFLHVHEWQMGSWICVPSLFTSKQRASLVQASLVRIRKPTHPESCLINYRTQWSWRCLGLQDKEAVYIQYKYAFFQLPHYRLKNVCPAYISSVEKCMYDRKLAINCFISLHQKETSAKSKMKAKIMSAKRSKVTKGLTTHFFFN